MLEKAPHPFFRLCMLLKITLISRVKILVMSSIWLWVEWCRFKMFFARFSGQSYTGAAVIPTFIEYVHDTLKRPISRHQSVGWFVFIVHYNKRESPILHFFLFFFGPLDQLWYCSRSLLEIQSLPFYIVYDFFANGDNKL